MTGINTTHSPPPPAPPPSLLHTRLVTPLGGGGGGGGGGDADTWLVLTLLPLYMVVGLIGHTTLISSILRQASLRQSVTNVYLINLCVTDVLYVTCYPLIITDHTLQDWALGPLMCKVYYLLVGVKVFTGTLTLLVAFIRSCIRLWFAASVCCTVRSALFTTLGIWVSSYVLILPLTVFASVVPRHSDDTLASSEPSAASSPSSDTCAVLWPSNISSHFIFSSAIGGYFAYMFLVGLIVPLCVLAVVSCFVAVGVSRGQPLSKQQLYSNIERDTLLLSVIILVYVICWVPYWTLLMYLIPRSDLVADNKSHYMLWLRVSAYVAYGQCAVNPCLAYCIDPRIRGAIMSLCAKQPDCQDSPMSRSTSLSGASNPVHMHFRGIDSKVDWMELQDKCRYGQALVPVVVARGHRSLELIAKPAYNPRFSTAW